MIRMEDRPRPYVSWLWRTPKRPSGASWWGERSVWVRHGFYWALAAGLLSLSVIDRSDGHTAPGSVDDVVPFAWFAAFLFTLPIVFLVFTLREWELVGATRTISRSLVLFAVLLGILGPVLHFTYQWGVHIDACRTVEGVEHCSGQSSQARILDLLLWHAANVVPVLDITDSMEWARPARSGDAVVGVSVIGVRLWVALGILGVVKRLWDRWDLSRSSGRPD